MQQFQETTSQLNNYIQLQKIQIKKFTKNYFCFFLCVCLCYKFSLNFKEWKAVTEMISRKIWLFIFRNPGYKCEFKLEMVQLTYQFDLRRTKTLLVQYTVYEKT